MHSSLLIFEFEVRREKMPTLSLWYQQVLKNSFSILNLRNLCHLFCTFQFSQWTHKALCSLKRKIIGPILYDMSHCLSGLSEQNIWISISRRKLEIWAGDQYWAAPNCYLWKSLLTKNKFGQKRRVNYIYL